MKVTCRQMSSCAQQLLSFTICMVCTNPVWQHALQAVAVMHSPSDSHCTPLEHTACDLIAQCRYKMLVYKPLIVPEDSWLNGASCKLTQAAWLSCLTSPHMRTCMHNSADSQSMQQDVQARTYLASCQTAGTSCRFGGQSSHHTAPSK